MSEIYEAREDSYFFCEFLKKELQKIIKKRGRDRELRFLDMGCGSCIIADCAKDAGIERRNIVCADINKNAVKLAKKRGFRAYKSDLFENLGEIEGFDVICFNAPYLPKDENEPSDNEVINCGGKRGDEISLKFIKSSRRYLRDGGKIFLLISSLTPQNRISKLRARVCAKKKIFFEELIILEF